MFTRFANTRPCRATATPLDCVSECFTKTIDSTVVCCHLKFLKAEINVKVLNNCIGRICQISVFMYVSLCLGMFVFVCESVFVSVCVSVCLCLCLCVQVCELGQRRNW